MTGAALIHPDLGNGLTNHEPMVTSALKELGASNVHIQRYQAMMAQKTQPVTEPATAIQNDSDLQRWLGRHENYAGLHQYFEAVLAQTEVQTVLNRYMPMLKAGITGGAFHPLIRLGHALHDNNRDEIAASLAYWVWAYQALPFPQADAPQDCAPMDIMPTLLEGVEWSSDRLGGGLITQEFERVVDEPGYQQLRFRVTENRLAFADLNALAIGALWMHDDFTLLHGVTGMQAVGRITALLDDKKLLLEPMWKGLIVAWLSKGLRWQPFEWPKGEPALSVVEIRTLAAHAMRDHTVKLVATCLDNYRTTEEAIYLHVAEREIRNDEQLQAIM